MSHLLVAPLNHLWVQSLPALSNNLEGLTILGYAVLGMGLLDSVLGGDDDVGDDGDDEEVVDGGEVMFGDDDDLGDLDDMGEMDDDEFGDMDDLDDGGGDSQGLEPRVSDLENELADVSSTMSTVRTENEQIAETVDEVEDNVRKLLEIYEMVTRGVNPFVDDVQAGGGGGMDGESFGLFEDSGSSDTEEVDESISEADAESFFDEDLSDDAETMDDDLDQGMAEPAGDEPMADDLDVTDEEESNEDGKSFEDLKAEYESGEAEWDGDDGSGSEVTMDTGSDSADVTVEADDDVDFFDDEAGDDFEDGPVEGESESDDSTMEISVDESPKEEVPEDDTLDEELDTHDGESDEDDDAVDDTGDGAVDDTGGFDFATTTVAAQASLSKPYLSSLPSGYTTDLVVMEWLDHLRSSTSTGGALRALRYYEDVGWIAPAVTRDLEDVLIHLDAKKNGEREEHPESTEDLTMEAHLTSLGYVVQLADGGQVVPNRATQPPMGGVTNGL